MSLVTTFSVGRRAPVHPYLQQFLTWFPATRLSPCDPSSSVLPQNCLRWESNPLTPGILQSSGQNPNPQCAHKAPQDLTPATAAYSSQSCSPATLSYLQLRQQAKPYPLTPRTLSRGSLGLECPPQFHAGQLHILQDPAQTVFSRKTSLVQLPRLDATLLSCLSAWGSTATIPPSPFVSELLEGRAACSSSSTLVLMEARGVKDS